MRRCHGEESRHVRYFHAGSRLRVRPHTCADRPDLIIDHLNQAFLQVGSRLGFQAIVELSGLPTLAEVEEVKDDLRTGRRGLTDLAKFVV